MPISFFVKRAFFNVDPGKDYDKRTKPPRGHLQRVSSIIRADQIAEYLGAKVNPTEGYENDVCIYVKPHYLGGDFKFEGKPYIDICDSRTLYQLALKYPEVPVIAASDYNYELLKSFLPNKIINIPEQHCNFERKKRTRQGIKTVGIIGTEGAFAFLPEGLEAELNKRGIELYKFSKFYNRQDVVDFYMNIDLQIVWRPYFNYKKDILMNPLKIVNSASFGIPTIAYDEPCFEEMFGCYMPVQNMNELLEKLDDYIASPEIHQSMADRCLEQSEKYHISNIAKLYEQL